MDRLWRSLFRTTTPACSIEDIYGLLVAVLPIFIDLADMNHSFLEATGAENNEALMSFCINFKAGTYNLHSALHRWGPFETLQKLSTKEYEDEVRNELSRVLGELETRFLSWEGENAKICKSLGLHRNKDESYQKLRALSRILPDDDELNENSMDVLSTIVRIGSSSSRKRDQLLQSLQSASSFLYDLESPSIEDGSSCAIKFEHYPFQHIKGLTGKLFEVLSRSWPCRCPSTSHSSQCPGASHISRKTRLNLTQHQQFETVPRHGQKISSSKALFRILFPTGTPYDHWQDTEITIHSRASGYFEILEVKRGLYEIVRNVRVGIRPKMAIFSNKLWQLRADTEVNPACPPQVQDGQFKSLKDPLEPNQSQNQSVLSSIEGKDRLILSFILTTIPPTFREWAMATSKPEQQQHLFPRLALSFSARYYKALFNSKLRFFGPENRTERSKSAASLPRHSIPGYTAS